MRVMVIGATGFIGPPLALSLQRLGFDAICVSRSGLAGVAADRSEPGAIARLAIQMKVDAVVDLLAMTEAATTPLLDALDGRVARYVLASSGDVYRQYGVLHRKEAAAGPGAWLNEDAPLRRSLYPYRLDGPRKSDDPEAWFDDYDKILIETALRARPALEGVICRLPMVFGPGDRQRRFAWAIRPTAAHKPVVETDSRWATWRTTYGFVDDVAHGLALAASHPLARGRTYNLGMAEAPDHATWLGRFAVVMGWSAELRQVTSPRLDSLDLEQPFVLDTRRIRRELGYDEPTEPLDALHRTIEDELRRSR